jgi:hypothetical protein
MYADPITITVNAVAKVCPRVFTPAGPSTFKMNDDEFKVEISHQNVKGRRERHLIRVTQRKIGADPLVPATNLESKMSAYLVLDNPLTGYSDTEQGYLISALAAFITNATNLSKFVGGEA